MLAINSIPDDNLKIAAILTPLAFAPLFIVAMWAVVYFTRKR